MNKNVFKPFLKVDKFSEVLRSIGKLFQIKADIYLSLFTKLTDCTNAEHRKA